MPVLSVVIPVRNQARSLKRLLDNLKAQKTPPGWEVEIIVAENMSTDNTLDVVRESGVKYVICERLGSGAARNAGAQAARETFYTSSTPTRVRLRTITFSFWSTSPFASGRLARSAAPSCCRRISVGTR